MISPDRTPEISGIYALARLDDAPVDPADAATLGFQVTESQSCQARGSDEQSPNAVHAGGDGRSLTILVGHIEEADELAERLQLARGTPPVQVARAALARFGADMPAEAIGEWSLFDWRPGQVTLMIGAARRDRLFYAFSGTRLAVAPDLFRLAKLSWVGNEMDEAGFLLALSRGEMRRHIGDRTMLARVRQLEPGSSITISAQGIRSAAAQLFGEQPRWAGSFDDAMAEAERLLRTVIRERLSRAPSGAVMLSGGLDSSTLAAFAASECQPDQTLSVFTSIAPPDSGLTDEAAFADSVAACVGLPPRHIYPSEDANIFRPPDYILAGAGGPPLPTRHCLTESFQIAARARGAAMLLDGTWGELTVSAYSPDRSLRHRLAAFRTALRDRIRMAGRVPDAFHVRLSRNRVAELPESVTRGPGESPPQRVSGASKAAWGYHPGAAKALRHPNEFYAGAVRVQYPYRDLRLLRLFAGFPPGFADRGGVERAPVRHITRGRLPDSIRLRTSGGPASPDHLQRMHYQAAQARLRLDTFRRAEVGEWLDLDWLDAALCRFSIAGPRDYRDANDVQLTAITAEFLTWWRMKA